MLKTFAAFALALGLLSCGDEAQVEELKQYVKTIQKFHGYNVKVQKYIERLGDLSIEKTETDIVAARKLLAEYASAVEAVADPDDNTLRSTHELYLRSFTEAARVATDKTGDLKRQAHSVKIGFSKLRTSVGGRFYPSVVVLLARKDLDNDEYSLKWPERK